MWSFNHIAVRDHDATCLDDIPAAAVEEGKGARLFSFNETSQIGGGKTALI